jgi:LL-diaminopimelate aminotransferase
MIIPPAHRLDNVSEYYFSQKLQQIREMNASGLNVINLGIGSPDMSPSEATIAKLTEVTNKAGSHGYQGYKGIPEFREAIARWYKKIYDVTLNGEKEILPLLGSKEGIMHISMAFLNQGDEVLIPDPGYPTYSSVTNLVQAKIREYSLDEKNNWAPDLKALDATDLTKVKIMWLNYPNMPTGAKATDSLFRDVILFAKKHKILICHDNPYSLILPDGKPKSILAYEGAFDVAIELNSLSKSHNMAGWRVGWVSGNKEYIDTILKVKSNVDSGMFLPVQHAAAEAFNNSQQWHDEQNAAYANRRDAAWKLLDALNCRYDKNQVGLFVWAKVSDEIPDVANYIDNFLQKANVFITPGFIFGKKGERFIRLSLCSTEKVFAEALQRILKIM